VASAVAGEAAGAAAAAVASLAQAFSQPPAGDAVAAAKLAS
jgi:hypothetical protein